MSQAATAEEPAVSGGCGRSLSTAVLIALAVVLILALALPGFGRGLSGWEPFQAPRPWREGPGISTSSAASQASPDPMFRGFCIESSGGPDDPGPYFSEGGPERRSVYSALSRLYSTADVDPLITGRLYEYSDGVRDVYAERTSHGDIRGLTEYSSGGGAGDVGVDIGPFGLDEYGGRVAGFDDGIPGPWALPSTPVRWYAPKQRDYYGPEGPTVYSEGLYSLWEPDHQPEVN